MNTDRRIIHIDMDAFFSSIEKRNDPSLKNIPIAVGSTERGGVVASCCYVARSFGVRNAMPSWKAKELCPNITFVNPNFEEYRKASEKLSDILYEFTPLVEFVSIDEAYVDLTDLDVEEVCKEIRKRIEEEIHVTATIGLSYNKFLAKISSGIKKPNSFNITLNGVDSFLENLPIQKFRGVGKKTAEFFLSKGIISGNDLKNLELSKLIEWFGDKIGNWYYNIARGIDDRIVDPTEEPRKSLNVNETFTKNIWRDEDAVRELEKLAERLEIRIAKNKVFGSTLIVRCKYPDFKVVTRSITTGNLITDRKQILKIAIKLLKNKPLKKPVRLIGLTLTNLKDESRILW